jgi:hypothetical protein
MLLVVIQEENAERLDTIGGSVRPRWKAMRPAEPPRKP